MAHRNGVLTAASLMVAAPAAPDAIARARHLPRLRVGLHIALVEDRPLLPPQELPDLVDAAGRFRSDMARLALDIFTRPRVRRQVQAEIEAQFKAYAASGLALDHVNAHKHFHLHPTIAQYIIAIGRRYGLRALRVPREPAFILAEAEGRTIATTDWLTAPWAMSIGRAARRAGLRVPDAVFGLAWSGAMTPQRLERLIRRLPQGLSEIYLHPATDDAFAGHARGYRYKEELAALTAPAVITAARQPSLELGGYADFLIG